MTTLTPEEFRQLNRTAKSKNREQQMQVACVTWFRLQYPQYQKLLISVPNGAALTNGAASWGRLKAEGAVAGAADLLLLVPRGEFPYLAIEMKTAKGRQRESQREWMEAVRGVGGRYEVVRSTFMFEEVLKAYLAEH